MRNIIVLNSGSTSVKYKLYDEDEKELKTGSIVDVVDHEKAIRDALRGIGDLRDIVAVGHRVVHGGDDFTVPTIIDEKNYIKLESYSELAPLHNPYNLLGIKAASEFLPNVPQVAVFDTAFYADLPAKVKTYALSEDLTQEAGIKKYGFHGTSHNYVLLEAAKKLNKKPEKTSIISCHLGGGWSVTATRNGKAIDTSMGNTPLEGLVMMTRCGDLDPGVVMNLIDANVRRLEGQEDVGFKEVYEKIEEVNTWLNKESGIKGVCGATNYKGLLRELTLGNEKAKLAFDIAMYRLAKYIGGYFLALKGKVDAIVFTGSIGSGEAKTRNEIKKLISPLGEIKIMSVETDEELMIMREARKIISN